MSRKPPRSSLPAHRQTVQASVEAVHQRVLAAIERGEPLVIVKAPPGSGKTYLLLRAVAQAFARGMRVAVAAQTRSQADDICHRLASDYADVPAVRFATGKDARIAFAGRVRWTSSKRDIPLRGPAVVVATAAKFGAVRLDGPCDFDVLIVEEAWQMPWVKLMLLADVSSRFVLIGDPGQIPPVVKIDTARWETSPRAPHRAAPEVVVEQAADFASAPVIFDLPATRRLPHDTTALVRGFYDFHFDSWAAPGDRSLVCARPVNGQPSGLAGVHAAIDALETGTVTALTIPTPAAGPPVECDREMAALAVAVVRELLARDATFFMDGTSGPLCLADIGIAATHRAMTNEIALALPGDWRDAVRVDTAERWQGLERKLMIAVHPLSGVVRPSVFDLDTGRLCVMMSRHQVGLVLLSRDHIGGTLDDFVPAAEQAVGRPDRAGRGHFQHWRLWHALQSGGRVIDGNAPG